MPYTIDVSTTPLSDHLKLRLVVKKGGKLGNVITNYVILSNKKNTVTFVSLAMPTRIIRHNMIFRICRSIGHHFKSSVSTLTHCLLWISTPCCTHFTVCPLVLRHAVHFVVGGFGSWHMLKPSRVLIGSGRGIYLFILWAGLPARW